MGKFKDISGQRFGKLRACYTVRVGSKSKLYWLCICDCGRETAVSGSSLRSGRSSSCGCKTNQSHMLKFKKENPNASYDEIVRERIKAHTQWNGECLEWTATISNGYGVFVYKGKTINASRAAWISENGEIPKGLCVLHNCPGGMDNRKCCNTKHMFLGTHKENTQDMIKKKRDRWDTCRKFPVGTTQKVGLLREQGKMYREIGKELGLTMDQVKSQLQNYKRIQKKFVNNSAS